MRTGRALAFGAALLVAALMLAFALGRYPVSPGEGLRVLGTALGMLTRLERALAGRGIVLWLAEVKGPVMDRLADTELGTRLRGRIFLSTHEAFLRAAADREHP